VTLSTLDKYGTSFQVKVISSLLTHKEFLQNINDILSPEYFSNHAHSWIINQILDYYEKYHTTPTMEVLKVEMKKVSNEVLQLSIKEQLREAYQTSDEDLKYVEEEFANFCKNQQLKKALLNSVDLLNSGDFESIRGLIDSALKAGAEKNIGHEYSKDTENRYREESRKIVPTPWDKFNELMQGGIGNGDFGLIFGNPGGGKSWTMVAIAGYAVKLGYNVVYYTLELGEDYVGRRFDAYFTGHSVDTLFNHRKDINDIVEQLPGQLIIKEYAPGQATVNTLRSHIQKCSDLNFKPDLVVIDYVDLLSSRKRVQDRKGEIDDIYLSTKGLAKELQIPVWSVSQVNRAGAKDDVIEGDKAAGSYDKIMVTDIAISLSRKKEDKVNGTGRFHIMKNRYGMDGMTFSAKIDTSTGHFEVTDHHFDGDETPPSNKFASNANFNSLDRELLAQQFFQLNS
jgi:replicative DNA helicase